MVQQQEKAKITKAERERKTAEEQAEQLKKENEQKEIEKQRNFVIKKFEMLSSEQQETVIQTIFEQVGQGIFKVIEDNHLHFAPNSPFNGWLSYFSGTGKSFKGSDAQWNENSR